MQIFDDYPSKLIIPKLVIRTISPKKKEKKDFNNVGIPKKENCKKFFGIIFLPLH